MGTYTRLGLAGAGVTCGLLLLALSVGHNGDDDPAASTQPRNATAAPPKGPYVALGDSYTSGPGIPARTGTPAGCDRSDRNYPALVAQKLEIKAADFRDVSCSGATLADLSAPQTTGDGVNPAQLSALSASTRLVTIGIGGNDIEFGSLVESCVKQGALYVATGSGKYTGDDAPCRGRYVSDSGDTDEVRQRIQAAGERLADTLREVEHRAPQAQVYVVGYPAILPAKGAGCDDDMTLAPDDATYLDDKERQLNSVLRERAASAGAGYVDTYTPSAGRDACSARETRWVEPLIPANAAAPVHPNERGERGMADAVLRTLKASR
ncbi:SGNH/GDSL hydrolase family protein [Streptomyces sp. NBC_00564]|uniref:SGNH/GDSL hydrolase family protein n=1 Tax=Streptomyces sp. NBC_00564 TaxID=2903663 RepID=UPI00352EF134|nr:SGNH/GDSL hydrolase family protein [Streptomyces sp. NBC_00564]